MIQPETVDSESVPAVAMTESETEQLMDAVRKQVEYYFSKENLQSDAYLTSHMDANMTVAIATVMKVHSVSINWIDSLTTHAG
jgi:hypothetical protein